MKSISIYTKELLIVLFCTLTVSLFSYAAAYAQEEKKFELSIGYGWNTTNNGAQDLIVGMFVHALGGSYQEKARSGAYYAKFQSHVAKRVLVGVYASLEKTTDAGSDWLSGEHWTMERRFFTLALEVQFQYIAKPAFQMYSLLGIGNAFVKEKESVLTGRTSSNNFNAFKGHLSVLGLRVGKTIGLHAELGYGYKGVINGGLSVQF
jgi:hypothetical protein